MRRFLQVPIITLLICLHALAWAQAPQTVDNGQQTQAVTFTGAGCVYNWTNNKPGIGLPASGTGNIAAFTAINNGTTPVVATIKAIPVLATYAYIANQGTNKVTVIDGATHAVIKTIDIGTTPVGVTASADGKYIYVANNVTNDVSVISTADNTLVKSIPVGTNPFGITISPDGKWVYTGNQNDASISVINTQTNSVFATISPILSISSLCVSPDGKWVYAATESGTNAGLYIINAATNAIDSIIPISDSQNDGMVITPDGKTLYFTNNLSKSITIVNLVTRAVSTLPVGNGPYGIAINSTGTRVYVACSYANEVDVINTATNIVIRKVPTTGAPFTVSVSSDDKEFYVTNRFANAVDVFSTANYSKVTTISGPDFSSPMSLGNFISKGPDCGGSPVTFTITVNPTVSKLIATGASGTISACEGSPSASPDIQQFTLSGSALKSLVTVQAPPNFEVSLNPATGYAASLSLSPSAGTLNNTIIYVRSSQAASGIVSDKVAITSAGAAIVTVGVSGIINALPTVNSISDQTKANGEATDAVNFTGSGNTFTWTNDNPSIGLPANGTGNIASFAAINNSGAAVKATITVHPLIVPCAYIANNASNDVAVINILTNEIITRIPVEGGPVGVAVSPDGKRAYVANSGSGSVSVINTITNKLITSVPVDVFPHGIVVSPDGGKVYVANYNSNTISVINTSNYLVESNFYANGASTGLAISPDGSLLYVTSFISNSVAVVSTATHNLVSTINVGLSPIGVVVSPDGGKLYVANSSENYVSVIDLATNATSAKVITGLNPSGLSISPDGSKVYVTNAGSGTVSVIDATTNSILSTVPVGSKPNGLSVSRDGRKVYVANPNSQNVSVINTIDNSVSATIPVTTNPNSFGNFTTPGSPCDGTPVKFVITVKSSGLPGITTGPVTGTITTCAGSPSAGTNIQQFTVAATGLTTDVTAAAPANFEVSLSAAGRYAHSIIIKQSAGVVNGVIVYVRSAASAPPGSISDNVSLTSAGVAEVKIAVNGVVKALPDVSSPGNQKTYNNGDLTNIINFTGTGNIFNWVNDTPAIGLAASGTGDISSFTATNTGAGTLTATVTVTPVSGSLAYVANGNDNSVSVINTISHQLLTTIPVAQYPTYVSVSPDAKRLYVVNSNSNSISVINTSTNKVITEIPVGSTNQAIVSPDNKFLYVTDFSAKTIRVINTETFAQVAALPLPEQPAGIALNADGSKLYVANPLANSVSVIDIAAKTLTKTINTGSRPQGVLLSPDGSRIYVTNFYSNDISVINTATNNVDFTISTMHANPDALTISPDGNTLYVANFGDGSVSMINTVTSAVLATVATGIHPSGVDISADGAFVYVVNQGANNMSVISTASGAVTATIPTGNFPNSPGKFIVNGTGCTGVPVVFTIKVNARPPAITAGPVTGSITACAGSPSASPNLQQFTVSGSGLSGDITVAAPIGFEVSLAGNSGYANSVKLIAVNGAVTNVMVYVRSADYAAGSVPGNVGLSTPGLATQTVAVSGFVNALPTIATVSNQTKTGGEATDAISFAGTGDTYTWTNDKPEIGLTATGSGDIASFITVNNSASPIVATIMATPSSSATGCMGKPVTFTITVLPLLPAAISNTVPVNGVNTIYGTPSPAASFTISGSNMREGITVTPPAGTEVSIDNINFSQTITVGAAGTIAPTTIYIRLAKNTSVGPYQGPIALTSSGASTVSPDLPLSMVSPAPLTITAANKTKDYGTLLTGSSGVTDFSISGLQNSETAETVTISYGNGAAANAPAGNFPGSVIPSAITGGTFDPKNYSPTYINGDIIINSVPLTITADDKSKVYKDLNPIFTVTYNGFVNNEGPAQLTSLPVTSTIADVTSLPGKYPILVSAAASSNYNIIYVNGVLTVLGINVPLTIPNTFTPNNDGINDTWNIANIDSYPDCTVNIYNRWGQNVFSSVGYSKSWDGKYRGAPLPVNTYYYIIDLKNNNKPYAGNITLIR